MIVYNAEQAAAIEATPSKPLLLVAGAGSGKTATLVGRINRLVADGVPPDQILALTFSRKAADELTERINAPVAATTLHAFGYSRIRDWRHAHGVPTLQLVVNPKPHVARLLSKPSADYPQAINRDLPIGNVLAAIARWQNNLIGPDEAIVDTEDMLLASDYARAYRAYTKWKRDGDRCDFADMLTLVVELYDNDPSFLAGDRARWHYGLVDELQDTNVAQWAMIDRLFADRPLFGVGDVRQAIYQWRGARPDLMVDFPNRWDDVAVMHLTVNYRSTPEIVETAEALIGHAPAAEQMGGRLVANAYETGRQPELLFADNQTDEAEAVADMIGGWTSNGVTPGEIAVLYRVNAQSAHLEDALSHAGIPYQVVGSKGFWASREVVDLLAYLRVTVDPSDVESFGRALSAPSRYLGRAYVSACAAQNPADLTVAATAVTSYSGRSMSAGQLDNAAEFAAQLLALRSLRHQPPAQLIEWVANKTGYRRWLERDEPDGEDSSHDDTIGQLIAAATRFDTIDGLVAWADKQQAYTSRSAKPDRGKVQLMTVHRAKGLEWDRVIVVGFVDGMFPHHRSLPDVDEERRIAYVAMTRPRYMLTLSVPESTFRGPADPSRFLTEAGLLEPVSA